MIALFLRKAFYDGWDNVFTLILINIVGLIPVILVAFGSLASESLPIFMASIGGLFLCLGVHAVASSFLLGKAVDYQQRDFSDYLEGLRQGWRRGLFLGAVVSMAAICLWAAVPFYSKLPWPMGPLILGMIGWFVFFFVLALQWFPSVCHRLPGSLGKQLRKCCVLAFDNVGFSLFLALTNAIALVASLGTFFLIPGLAGVWLGTDAALRLRLQKYEWLGSHPSFSRRNIPWSEILHHEDELVGHRSLRSFLFPWKD